MESLPKRSRANSCGGWFGTNLLHSLTALRGTCDGYRTKQFLNSTGAELLRFSASPKAFTYGSIAMNPWRTICTAVLGVFATVLDFWQVGELWRVHDPEESEIRPRAIIRCRTKYSFPLFKTMNFRIAFSVPKGTRVCKPCGIGIRDK